MAWTVIYCLVGRNLLEYFPAMALVTCPDCKNLVSTQAAACPACGRPVHRVKKSSPWWLWILLPVVAFLGFLTFLGGLGSQIRESAETKENNDAHAAYIATTELVSRALKSPSTAKFPAWREVDWRDSGTTNVWDFGGWVDSQNGFGAMIRTRWRAQITLEKDQYQLLYLKLGDEVIGKRHESPEQFKTRLAIEEAKQKRIQEQEEQEARERAVQQFLIESNANYIKAQKDSDLRRRVTAFRFEQATNGAPSAQYEISKLYLAGSGESNRTLGMFWLEKAASGGHQNAKLLYDTMRTNGTLVLKE